MVSLRKCDARHWGSSLSLFRVFFTASMASAVSVEDGLRSCQAMTTSRASFIQGPGLTERALARSVPLRRGLKVSASRIWSLARCERNAEYERRSSVIS